MRRIIAAISLLLAAQILQAETCDCSRDCAERVDPALGMQFEDREHRLWYEVRFWTGKCTKGLSWCFSGRDWYDVMSSVLERTPAAERDATCARLFDLGKRIGHEWARDNDIRRISTRDLKSWRRILLNKSTPPASAIQTTEQLTDERLGPTQ